MSEKIYQFVTDIMLNYHLILNYYKMKKIIIGGVFLGIYTFYSCSDYDDTQLEEELTNLKNEIGNLSHENDSLKHLNDCVIKSFYFTYEDNPLLLNETVYGVIRDSVINVRIPNICLNKKLIPTIEFENNNSYIETPTELNDFNSPVDITVANGVGKVKTYRVSVSSYTGLPMMFVYTNGGANVVSKDNYIRGTASTYNNISLTRSFAEATDSMSIRGRGNSTWGMPKKPYQIKFDKKKELLGMPKDKTWVLLANYSDKSNLRWETACELSRMSCLEWTPRTRFVELFMNDRYTGTYVLCEKIKIADDRVNVGDNGYILEVDQPGRLDVDDVYFTTDKILCNIKDPDLEYDDDNYTWVKNFITQAEQTLYSDNFLDKLTGYKTYIDINSFVDWYIVNEIARNNDAIFFSSCYMNVKKGGKLKMGPIWDFDIAFGNCNYNDNWMEEGFYIKNAAWISRMFDDPEFVKLLKERYEFFYSKKEYILNKMSENASMLKFSAVENNNIWKTLYTGTWSNYSVMGAYDNEVIYMKEWISKRMDWLKKSIDGL